MDVLRPQIIRIGDRCYRKNPTLDRDFNALEEEEYEESTIQCDSWNDETCDTFNIEETDRGYQTSVNLPVPSSNTSLAERERRNVGSRSRLKHRSEFPGRG